MYNPANLRPGDIILVHGRPSWSLGGLLTWAIEWSTVSPFDHAAIVGNDGYLYEALWKVTRSPLGKYADNGYAYHVAGATITQGLNAGLWVRQRLGRTYGIRELLEDGGRYILHIPFPQRADANHYTCSGLVAAAWNSVGISLTYEPLPSPASLSYSPVLIGIRPWIIPWTGGVANGRGTAPVKQ